MFEIQTPVGTIKIFMSRKRRPNGETFWIARSGDRQFSGKRKKAAFLRCLRSEFESLMFVHNI